MYICWGIVECSWLYLRLHHVFARANPIYIYLAEGVKSAASEPSWLLKELNLCVCMVMRLYLGRKTGDEVIFASQLAP